MAVTNRGKKRILQIVFQAEDGGTVIPTDYYLVLCTNAAAPTVDTNTMTELTQIAAGNGYTSGGYKLDRTTTDFDTLTEDDSGDKAILQIKDIIWTASGNFPSSGNGARWCVLTDDNATFNSRDVFAYWDLGSDRTMTNGQTLTLQNLEVDATE